MKNTTNPLHRLAAISSRTAVWAIAVVGSLLVTSIGFAQATVIWNGTTDSVWATGTNWSTDPNPPATTDYARFNNAGNMQTTIDLGAGATIGRMSFTGASTAAYTIGSGGAGNQTLTFSNTLVDMASSVVNDQTINANLLLPSSTEFTFSNFSSSADLILAGDISRGVAGATSPIIKFGTTSGQDIVISGTLSSGLGAFWRFVTSRTIVTGNLIPVDLGSAMQGVVSGGTVQIGNGGTTGSLGAQSVMGVGAALGTGTEQLIFNRSDALSVGTRITGIGTVVQGGAGTTTLTHATNTITNATVDDGTLLVNGGLTTASGTATVNSGGTLGGAGTIAKAVVVSGGGTLLGGSGAVGTTLTLSGDLTTSLGSYISMTLGAGGTSSSLARTGTGTWSFTANQAFDFIDQGIEIGTYSNLITGLASDPGVTNWTIANPGLAGTFSFSGGNVSLAVTAIPEPSAFALLGLGLVFLVLYRQRKARA